MTEKIKVLATPAARRLAAERGIDILKVKGTGEFQSIRRIDVESLKKEVKVTPVAKKMAGYFNINISGIKTEGKICKKDIQDILSKKETISKAKETYTSNIDIQALKEVEVKTNKRVKMQGMRKVIARRMDESLKTTAQYTMCAEYDTTILMGLSKDAKKSYGRLGGSKLTVTDFLVKLTALALEKHPIVNTSIDGEDVVYHEEINIGVAVALDEGLIVPVVKNANKLSIGQINKIMQDLVGRARLGKLLPDEYMGSTLTISNIGMYPVDFSTPIINQPESGILGVGRSLEKPVVVEGEIKIRTMTGFSLTLDHRVVDGAEGAKFLKTFNELLQDPLCTMI